MRDRLALQPFAIEPGLLEGGDGARHLADLVGARQRRHFGGEIAAGQAQHHVAQQGERLGGGAADEGGGSEPDEERQQDGGEDDRSHLRLGGGELPAGAVALFGQPRGEVLQDRRDEVDVAVDVSRPPA